MKTIILLPIFVCVNFVLASEHYYQKNNYVRNAVYENECSACHMAYQPQFLPKRSWNKMMDELENHFDTDATLTKEDELIIRDYLNKNASDSRRSYGEMAEFADSISSSSIPLRISDIPKFKREHRKINPAWIRQNEVKSIANCNACHMDAKEGLYRERNILIPNVGRWDD